MKNNVKRINGKDSKKFFVNHNLLYIVTWVSIPLIAVALVAYMNHMSTKTYINAKSNNERGAAAMILGASSGWTVSGNKIYTTRTESNVGIGTTNPGSKLDVNGNIVFTNTQQNDLSRFLVNGINPSTEFSSQQGGNFATESLIVGVAVPSTSKVYGANGIASYMTSSIKGNDGISPSGTNVVAGYFQSRALVNNANIFGINPLLADVSGISGVRMSNEFDFNVNNPSTEVAGVRLYLAGSVTPIVANAFIVDRIVPSQWGSAFYSADGAAFKGIHLGTRGSGSSQESQYIVLRGKDSTNANREAQIFSNTDGALVLRSGQDGQPVVLQDFNKGGGANLLEVSSTNTRFYRLPTSPPDTSGIAGLLCITNNGNLWIDTTINTPCS